MAKKFSFRLEPVLKIKTHKVQEAKEEFAEAQILRITKENEIAERENYFHGILNKSGSRMASAADLQTQYHHKQFVRDEINRLEHQKTQLIEIEDLKRSALTEAMKEEKILEKLKEKKLNNYMEEINKEEVKIIDEIAVTRFSKDDLVKI